MKDSIFIDNKQITIYYNGKILRDKLPVIICNSNYENIEQILIDCNKIQCENFVFVTISNINWNDELSPWYMKKIYSKYSDYLGKADEFLSLITNKIIPQIEIMLDKVKIKPEYYSIIGYSLAGLFALYCGFKTDKFKRIASVSGSMWFEKFSNFVKENSINKNVEKIYFSLGDKEKKTNNPVLKTVEEKTIYIEKIISSKGIKTTLQFNIGNHFTNPEERLAKSIKWILE